MLTAVLMPQIPVVNMFNQCANTSWQKCKQRKWFWTLPPCIWNSSHQQKREHDNNGGIILNSCKKDKCKTNFRLVSVVDVFLSFIRFFGCVSIWILSHADTWNIQFCFCPHLRSYCIALTEAHYNVKLIRTLRCVNSVEWISKLLDTLNSHEIYLAS